MEAVRPHNLTKIVPALRSLARGERHIISDLTLNPRKQEDSGPHIHIDSLRVDDPREVCGVSVLTHISDSPLQCRCGLKIRDGDGRVVEVGGRDRGLWAGCGGAIEDYELYVFLGVAHVAQEDDVVACLHVIHQAWIHCLDWVYVTCTHIKWVGALGGSARQYPLRSCIFIVSCKTREDVSLIFNKEF